MSMPTSRGPRGGNAAARPGGVKLHEEIVQAKKVHAAEQDGRNRGTGFPPVMNSVDIGGTSGGGGQQGESDWLEIDKGGSKAVLKTPNARQSVSKSSVVR